MPVCREVLGVDARVEQVEVVVEPSTEAVVQVLSWVRAAPCLLGWWVALSGGLFRPDLVLVRKNWVMGLF